MIGVDEAERITENLQVQFARIVAQMTEFGWAWEDARSHLMEHVLVLDGPCDRCPWEGVERG